ncbi:uncharacterized protein [Coffea arabica]|uniref:Membrane-associated kinase regulator 1 n=1 Tax=Coffea arabica TaxID=13443 RepID=A0A6P6T7Z3_COFAR|nr:uncharacterized protein LOC113698603 [Coffea arabica]
MAGNDADADETRRHSNPVGSSHVVEREEEDEEALSFSDLPTNEENQFLVSRKESPVPIIIHDSQEEFNFCSSLATDSLSKESEMCVADEVFFQGQILPLRHSVSSESGLITKLQNDSRTTSRSESMDRCYSVGFTSLSSRSSSLNSHHSSSSGTTSSTSTTTGTGSSCINRKPRPKTRNHFQFSHPSPKPQIRSSNSIKNGMNSSRNSTLWSIFRVGLVTTPEIAIQDLKFRNNSKNAGFGSRNSTSSTISSGSAGRIKAEEKDRIKKRHKFLDKKGVVFFSGCKCSSNAVAGPIPSRVAENGMRRSASVSEAHAKEEETESLTRTTRQHDQQQTGKQALSRHRTFEWLKQLSLEAAAVVDEA